jgi:hypothetical protein
VKEQNLANHARYLPAYHFFTGTLVLAVLIGACVNLYHSLGNEQRLYSASLLVAVAVILLFLFWYARAFSLRAQDRAIRAEENLRHFALTGKLLDPRITMGQVIGLRFASDEEFVPLARRAAEEKLSKQAIKEAVKHWRADYHRA